MVLEIHPGRTWKGSSRFFFFSNRSARFHRKRETDSVSRKRSSILSYPSSLQATTLNYVNYPFSQYSACLNAITVFSQSPGDPRDSLIVWGKKINDGQRVARKTISPRPREWPRRLANRKGRNECLKNVDKPCSGCSKWQCKAPRLWRHSWVPWSRQSTWLITKVVTRISTGYKDYNKKGKADRIRLGIVEHSTSLAPTDVQAGRGLRYN